MDVAVFAGNASFENTIIDMLPEWFTRSHVVYHASDMMDGFKQTSYSNKTIKRDIASLVESIGMPVIYFAGYVIAAEYDASNKSESSIGFLPITNMSDKSLDAFARVYKESITRIPANNVSTIIKRKVAQYWPGGCVSSETVTLNLTSINAEALEKDAESFSDLFWHMYAADFGAKVRNGLIDMDKIAMGMEKYFKNVTF